jgi:hypothetical protein
VYEASQVRKPTCHVTKASASVRKVLGSERDGAVPGAVGAAGGAVNGIGAVLEKENPPKRVDWGEEGGQVRPRMVML